MYNVYLQGTNLYASGHKYVHRTFAGHLSVRIWTTYILKAHMRSILDTDSWIGTMCVVNKEPSYT